MPIWFEVDPARRLVMTTVGEVVTQADLRDYIASVLAHPDVRPGFRELVDLRGVTRIEIPPSVVTDDIPNAIKEHEQQLSKDKTAIVASEENLEEVSRLYDLIRGAVPATLGLFGDMDEAREWLGLTRGSRRSERRVAPRSTVQIAVLCSTGMQFRSTEIIDLSLSGALLSCPTIRPAIGVPVQIWWESPGAQGMFELQGTVVRHVEGGFAVRFQTATAELLWLLGDPF